MIPELFVRISFFTFHGITPSTEKSYTLLSVLLKVTLQVARQSPEAWLPALVSTQRRINRIKLPSQLCRRQTPQDQILSKQGMIGIWPPHSLTGFVCCAAVMRGQWRCRQCLPLRPYLRQLGGVPSSFHDQPPQIFEIKDPPDD